MTTVDRERHTGTHSNTHIYTAMKIKHIQDSQRNCHQVSYRDSTGKLKRKSFKTDELAREFVSSRERTINRKGQEFADISREERAMLTLALEKSRTHDFSLLDAVNIYIRNAGSREDIPLPEAKALFLEKYLNAKQDRRKTTQTSMTQTVNAFTDRFQGKTVREITGDDVMEFLSNDNWSVRTMINNRARLNKFFSELRDKGYRGDNPVDYVKHDKFNTDLGRAKDKKIKVLALGEVRNLFRASLDTMPEFTPYLVLGIFAGIRPTEITMGYGKSGMRWEHIDFQNKCITVPDEVSKTRVERTVTIHPNVMKWLKNGGELPQGLKPAELQRTALRKAVFGSEWKEKWDGDIMRHTYASYHLKHFRNAGVLREEMGHSENSRTLENFYTKNVKVTPSDAKDFWHLIPRTC